MDNRAELIGALSDAFQKSDDLKLDKENIVTGLGSLDCTAMGIPIDALEKTKRVIEQHETKFMKEKDDPMAGYYIVHLKIARKCVEEILALKRKNQ